MIDVTVLNKNTVVDEETLQPYLEATVTIKFPLEAMRDGISNGEINKLYKFIGEAISNELKK